MSRALQCSVAALTASITGRFPPQPRGANTASAQAFSTAREPAHAARHLRPYHFAEQLDERGLVLGQKVRVALRHKRRWLGLQLAGLAH